MSLPQNVPKTLNKIKLQAQTGNVPRNKGRQINISVVRKDKQTKNKGERLVKGW